MEMQKQREQNRAWARIVTKAWVDEAFKRRLLEMPATVLAQEGFEIPGGMAMTVVEITDGQGWLVLPRKPVGDVEVGEIRIAAAPYCVSYSE
ncbi:NHLP leader peptide family RiPP precursor [Solidesulfovibrio sp.]|uniref:NHLP leader peptide family RiPP precursor n=1 Tax=Solidesulfovibrio sp. TaxID=2910990 RepID=UPI002608B8C7|nr:NHLP leader peptide family RiPP precursor [Solidesulfovibrio sp.]